MSGKVLTALMLVAAFLVGAAFVKLLSLALGMVGLAAFALIGSALFVRAQVNRRRA